VEQQVLLIPEEVAVGVVVMVLVAQAAPVS